MFSLSWLLIPKKGRAGIVTFFAQPKLASPSELTPPIAKPFDVLGLMTPPNW
jgi:hypothetical protein